MSWPTSAPKASTPGKINKLKFRASCDSCAASKVKCSKEHPSCARCSAINSPCIYGISRKHGKPGRTRKRDADGTLFVKAAKQRLSLGSSEVSIFSSQPKHTLQQTDLEITSNWASDWSPIPSLAVTPGFDLETAPESSYASDIHSVTACMNNAVLPTQSGQPELRSIMESNHMNSMNYDPTVTKIGEPLHSDSSISMPYSPISRTTGTYDAMGPYLNSPMGNSHCCYTSAYSILDSLRHVRHTHPDFTKESFDAVLVTAHSAIRNLLQLLNCPCSSDPHLAMLYSSITSKILTWYQTAAGVNLTIRSSTSMLASRLWSTFQSSPFSQTLSLSSSVPSVSQDESSHLYIQPFQHQHYDFEELEQQKYRRQVILYELQSCRQLVEALANWRVDGPACEQAVLLYDRLGGWLKSEVYKTAKSIESREP